MESLAWAYGEVGYDEQGAEICGAGGESRLNAVELTLGCMHRALVQWLRSCARQCEAVGRWQTRCGGDSNGPRSNRVG
jgi:hypothetical protein